MQLVDWQLAEGTAARLVPPGPRLSLEDAVGVVDQLRALAQEADEHVRRYTLLNPADTGQSPVAVVDRPGWIRTNVNGFRDLLDPILQSLTEQRRVPMGPVMSAVGSRATGLEVGALLAYLATRVLGQFELLGPAPADGLPGGRLTLVAPNIVSAEQALGVDPRDFRLWVCLHEVTHRTQFGAAPWLHEHIRSLLRDYLSGVDLDPAALFARLRGAAGSLGDAIRGSSDVSLIELVQTPEQKAVLGRVTGLMSLLEGHADVVMDGVGPDVVPSVDRIRAQFDTRRQGGNSVERFLRRLFGIDMKMRQYAEGARFVRAVVAQVGMVGLNRVWSEPLLLPDADEIRNPERWLARVHPQPPALPAVNG